MREISAGIIIYRTTEEEPKFLLLYRGYWSFSKGKLEEGERSFRAALREVREETGIRPRELKFRYWFRVTDRYTFSRDRKKVSKTVVLYLAETKKKEIKLSGEQEGFGWFSFAEALKHLKHRNLRENLKKAYALVGRRPPKEAKKLASPSPRF